MARHIEGERTGEGGLRLYWQGWLPEGDPRAVIVIAHGASEHGGRYAHLVAHLVPQGYAVYAQDHRGHGRSEGPRAFVDRLDHAIADLDAFVAETAAKHPGVPVVMLAHSFGGCLGIVYASRHQERLKALVLSSPLAALEAASAVQRAAARVLSRVAPKLGIFEVEAGGISRDPEEVRLYDEDPLVYRGKLPVRTVAEIAAAVDTFPDIAGRITLPLLIVHGTADRIVPIDGAEMIAERAGSADKTFLRYEGGYHELLNEPPAEREKTMADVSGWIAERV